MTDLPPWDQKLTPHAAIAWLTHDPVTGSNLGPMMAHQVISVLKQCGFSVVADTCGPVSRMEIARKL